MSEKVTRKTPVYRAFSGGDIPAAHSLSIAAGWPHRIEDWQLMFDAGSGFVAHRVDGAVIGTALYWTCGVGQGTLGLVIVSPDEQGQGIGRKLMELVLDALGDRVTFLHATATGKPLYEKLGFKACGTVDQHQGIVPKVPIVVQPVGEKLRLLTSDDMPEVIELASRASGLDRSKTIPALLDSAQGVVLEGSEKLEGFSLCRRFGRGYMLGPVVATQSLGDQRAKALIAHWLPRCAGAFVRIDVPSGTGLNGWLNGLGLAGVATVVKMVRNEPIERHGGDTDAVYRVYGIINQAMG